MKSYRLFLTIFIGLGFSSFLLSQNKDQLFCDAVRSEASGDIASAISSYEKALKLGYSSKLYGNLGNLYFKIKQYGHSNFVLSQSSNFKSLQIVKSPPT